VIIHPSPQDTHSEDASAEAYRYEEICQDRLPNHRTGSTDWLAAGADANVLPRMEREIHLVQVSHDTKPAMLFKTERKPRIRIVLVEDHSIMRECLRALLEVDPEFDVVGEFQNAEEGLDGIRDLQPDVVLTDLALPGRSGIDLLGEVNRISPLTRKLVLTAHDNIQYVGAALGAGADGYVLKSARGHELMRAIRAVSLGQQFLCRRSPLRWHLIPPRAAERVPFRRVPVPLPNASARF
jgi:CheY-like chemotaxis protein